jgi:hypothetical protein
LLLVLCMRLCTLSNAGTTQLLLLLPLLLL